MKILIGMIDKIYKKILSIKKDVYLDFKVDSSNSIEFTSSYILDEEEWFIINEFSKESYFVNECKPQYNSTDLNMIKNNDYDKITCLCLIDSTKVCFQRVTPSLYINKRTALDFRGTPKIVNHQKQLTINEIPDAIYLFNNDSLYFRDLSKIKTIFLGIEKLQREASQPEVDEFLKSKFLLLSEFDTQDVGLLNRKRIADIGAKFEGLSEDKKKKLLNYAKHKTGIEHKKGKFIIKSDAQLKSLLYAMDQRYYYSDIYDENRLANSIKVVSPNH